MKKIVFAAVLIMSVICSCNNTQVASEKRSDTWQNLFDGKTLNGWVRHGGKAQFTVEDGAIVGTTVPNTHNSFLCTEKEYGDFILELEFKVDPNLNSGVQIRSHVRPDPNFGEVVYGYQVEIDPSKRAWSGGIQEELGRGWLCNLKNKPLAREAFKSGQWNHLRIEAVGSTFKTWLNGTPAVELVDSEALKGFIGFQVHKIKTNEAKQVRFRNIKIQVLD